MSAVSFDISISLGGNIAAPNRRPAEPMGEGGERLHEWAFGGGTRMLETWASGSENSRSSSYFRGRTPHTSGTGSAETV